MSTIKEEERDEIPGHDFAFPKQRKEPIHDAAHVRNAIARFNQVAGVTDEERDEAWKRIKHAASSSSSTPCFRKSPVVNGLAFQKKCGDTSSLVQSRDRKYLQHERNTGGRATPHA